MKKINSLTVKLISIGVIVLLLLIGNAMIGSKLSDRRYEYDNAVRSISSSAGGGVNFSDINIYVPYEEINESVIDGKTVKRKNHSYKIINPKKLNINAEIDSELRTIGIYSSPVFTGSVFLDCYFDLDELVSTSEIIYDKKNARISVMINDQNLISHPDFIINGKEYETYLCETGVSSNFEYKKGKMNFETRIKVCGAKKFALTINSEDTKLFVKSNWTSPGFTDFDFLPEERKITRDGFEASWEIPFASVQQKHTIGFSFVDPVNIYKKLDRAVNYGFLFIIARNSSFKPNGV